MSSLGLVSSSSIPNMISTLPIPDRASSTPPIPKQIHPPSSIPRPVRGSSLTVTFSAMSEKAFFKHFTGATLDHTFKNCTKWYTTMDALTESANEIWSNCCGSEPKKVLNIEEIGDIWLKQLLSQLTAISMKSTDLFRNGAGKHFFLAIMNSMIAFYEKWRWSCTVSTTNNTTDWCAIVKEGGKPYGVIDGMIENIESKRIYCVLEAKYRGDSKQTKLQLFSALYRVAEKQHFFPLGLLLDSSCIHVFKNTGSKWVKTSFSALDLKAILQCMGHVHEEIDQITSEEVSFNYPLSSVRQSDEGTLSSGFMSFEKMTEILSEIHAKLQELDERMKKMDNKTDIRLQKFDEDIPNKLEGVLMGKYKSLFQLHSVI